MLDQDVDHRAPALIVACIVACMVACIVASLAASARQRRGAVRASIVLTSSSGNGLSAHS
jgi:hypothetical protein